MKSITAFWKQVILVGALCATAQTGLGQEWETLFNGEDTAHWRAIGRESFPAQGWKIEDGILKQVPGVRSSDIITRKTYEEFELSFEWKVLEGANSGVKYFIIEDRGQIGHEYQLIDDERHPDARASDDRHTGSFYDVLSSHDKKLNPVGEFNHSKILVKGSHVEHWLNEVKVLEYELDSPELKAKIEDSKFNREEIFGTRVNGHILIQYHGGRNDEVWYRDIKIRDLSEAEEAKSE